jgi:hypothetical protein
MAAPQAFAAYRAVASDLLSTALRVARPTMGRRVRVKRIDDVGHAIARRDRTRFVAFRKQKRRRE